MCIFGVVFLNVYMSRETRVKVSGTCNSKRILMFTPNEYEYVPLGVRFRANLRSRTPNLYLFIAIELMYSKESQKESRGNGYKKSGEAEF